MFEAWGLHKRSRLLKAQHDPNCYVHVHPYDEDDAELRFAVTKLAVSSDSDLVSNGSTDPILSAQVNTQQKLRFDLGTRHKLKSRQCNLIIDSMNESYDDLGILYLHVNKTSHTRLQDLSFGACQDPMHEEPVTFSEVENDSMPALAAQTLAVWMFLKIFKLLRECFCVSHDARYPPTTVDKSKGYRVPLLSPLLKKCNQGDRLLPWNFYRTSLRPYLLFSHLSAMLLTPFMTVHLHDDCPQLIVQTGNFLATRRAFYLGLIISSCSCLYWVYDLVYWKCLKKPAWQDRFDRDTYSEHSHWWQGKIADCLCLLIVIFSLWSAYEDWQSWFVVDVKWLCHVAWPSYEVSRWVHGLQALALLMRLVDWTRLFLKLTAKGDRVNGALKMKGQGRTASDAMKKGKYTVSELKQAGYKALELKDAGCTASELNQAGFMPSELKEAGYTALDLREIERVPARCAFGCSLSQRHSGASYTARELKDAGFTVSELAEAECSAAELKQLGIKCSELKEVGFSASDLHRAGFTLAELKEAQVSAQVLKEELCCTISQLREAAYSGRALKEAGFKASQLQEEGFTAQGLRDAGYNYEQLEKAGYDIAELKQVCLFRHKELNSLMISVERDIGRTASQFRSEFYTAGELKEGGYEACELKAAGYTLSDLKEAGFRACELNEIGYDVFKLKGAGYTNRELKDAGFTTSELIVCFAAELKEAHCEALELREAGFAAWHLKQAGYNASELKAVGYIASEINDAGLMTSELSAADDCSIALTIVGYTPSESKKAKYAVSEPNVVGEIETLSCTTSSPKKTGFPASEPSEMKGAPSTQHAISTASELKDAVHTACELKEVNRAASELKKVGGMENVLCKTWPAERSGLRAFQPSKVKGTPSTQHINWDLEQGSL